MHSPTQQMNIATALRDLGVKDSTLTVAEKAKLDQEGYQFIHARTESWKARKSRARIASPIS